MSKKVILGVQVSDRLKEVARVQKILSEYGCHIKTRLGIHETTGKFCSPTGLLILETVGELKKIAELEKKLKQISGLTVKKMVF